MRNRALHDALRNFALEAAALLEAERAHGAEIPFEVVEEPGSSSPLYRYRPLTAEFLAERWTKLRSLPGCVPAAAALGEGSATYLRLQGLPGIDAEPALQAMLERLYEDATGFEFPEERFERLYTDVERSLYADSVPVQIAAPMLGLEMEADRVELAEGLALVRRELLELPAEAWLGRAAQAGVACVVDRIITPDQSLPLEDARTRFRAVQRALRLFKSGGVALGPLAHGRAATASWKPMATGSAGAFRGEPWILFDGEEPELRELLELIDRARPAGRIAWGLRRFELGCERALDTEALSDYLLALRGLLDGVDDAGRASLSLRLAALCAEENGRRSLQRRVELAFALERFLVGGGSGDAYVDTIGSESPRSLVLDIEEQLRAVLRDVLCGFLDSDLKGAADDILLTSGGEPFEIKARDLRKERRFRSEPQVEPESEPEPEPPLAAATADQDEDAGVTPSADWGFDEDAESYSAPV
ncbi:MAG: hypothetical protein ACJ76V_06485 [Thermoleophilaceae bacterium]